MLKACLQTSSTFTAFLHSLPISFKSCCTSLDQRYAHTHTSLHCGIQCRFLHLRPGLPPSAAQGGASRQRHWLTMPLSLPPPLSITTTTSGQHGQAETTLPEQKFHSDHLSTSCLHYTTQKLNSQPKPRRRRKKHRVARRTETRRFILIKKKMIPLD